MSGGEELEHVHQAAEAGEDLEHVHQAGAAGEDLEPLDERAEDLEHGRQVGAGAEERAAAEEHRESVWDVFKELAAMPETSGAGREDLEHVLHVGHGGQELERGDDLPLDAAEAVERRASDLEEPAALPGLGAALVRAGAVLALVGGALSLLARLTRRGAESGAAPEVPAAPL